VDGGVPRLQSRRAVALVGGVVFLVDDHEADITEWRRNRQAGAHDDVHVAGPDPAPLVGTFAVAQPRVDEGDPDVQVAPQPIDQRHGQGDLRDQQQRGPAHFE
jgi:hypothetical protein